MDHTTRSVRAALTFCLPSLLMTSAATGQQLGAPQAYPQQQAYSQPAAPAAYPQTQATAQPQVGGQQQPGAAPQPAPVAAQVPQEFQLNQLQQGELDQVLGAWQVASSKISTFKCSFKRWEYDVAFGPTINGRMEPLNKNLGELSYNKPDKGSFEITEINTFKQQAAPPNQQPPAPIKGDWVKQPDAIGEHWVSDGKSIYEYRPHDKQLVERPIPPQLQGQAIVDGPLPFLFGAEATKLKHRYWMKIEHFPNENPKQIWLLAAPKFQQQAADFRQVEVIFNRELLMPEAMQVTLPNGDRHAYMFDLATARTNGPLNWLNSFFTSPPVPFGWKRVVENMPVAEAPQPVQQPR